MLRLRKFLVSAEVIKHFLQLQINNGERQMYVHAPVFIDWMVFTL